MEHGLPLVTTLAAAFGFALVLGLVAVRLKIPPLVGYLLAGVIIGPATPGFVADLDLAHQLSEIGVMLMMFGVGLHFSLDDLMEVRKIALPGAIAQITVATALGLGVAQLWGWSVGAGLVFGLALSVASTVVLLRSLEDDGLLHTIDGRIGVGWLVVEDLVMVLVLVMLPPLGDSLGGDGREVAASDVLTTLAVTLGQVAMFVALMWVGGRRVLPWLLWQVARSGSRELFTLCVIAVAVGIAYGASALFGVSFALGAFFAGMVLRESRFSHRAADESLPLREAFSVLFFVSVGMLFDPQMLVSEPLRVLIVVGIIVIGKSLAAFAIVRVFGYPRMTAFTVSASLAQIGEFSFILAGLGVTLGVLPEEGQSLILAGAVISIAINPLLFDAVGKLRARAVEDPAATTLRSRDPLVELPTSVDSARLTAHVVLVGYGRVGKRICDALEEKRVTIVVAEQNRELVEALRARNIPAVYGNAAESNVLIQAHIARARMLIVTSPDAFQTRKMLETARALNPKVETVVRTHSDDEAALLQKEDVGGVFMGEHELARGMTRHVMARLGESSSAR